MVGTGSKSPVLTIKKMKKSVLVLALFFATVYTLNAQERTAPSKSKFGVTLSTNLFGLDDDLSISRHWYSAPLGIFCKFLKASSG